MTFNRKRSRASWRITIIAVMICMSSVCGAAPGMSIGLSGGLEVFNLKEFDSSGSRLLSEAGDRYVTTVLLDKSRAYNHEASLLYHLEAAAYWGQVSYDGQTQSLDPAQSNLPVTSDTDYQGGRAEALLGYRFQRSIIPQTIEVAGGLGVDGWSRRIADGTASNGILVSGIHEVYRTYYGKVALGLTHLYPSNWYSHLRLGLKIPFNISEDVGLQNLGYDSDLTVSPGNAYSGFVTLLFEPQANPDKPGNLFFSVYYDGFRFDPSKAKTATHNGSPIPVWQPKTQIDVYGLQIGYRF